MVIDWFSVIDWFIPIFCIRPALCYVTGSGGCVFCEWWMELSGVCVYAMFAAWDCLGLSDEFMAWNHLLVVMVIWIVEWNNYWTVVCCVLSNHVSLGWLGTVPGNPPGPFSRLIISLCPFTYFVSGNLLNVASQQSFTCTICKYWVN